MRLLYIFNAQSRPPIIALFLSLKLATKNRMVTSRSQSMNNGYSKHCVLITGANRGIGLELTKKYLNSQRCVIASCRDLNEASELRELQQHYTYQLMIEELELSDKLSIETFCDRIAAKNCSIQVMINNAGFLDRQNQSIFTIDYEAAHNALSINALAPLYLVHKLLASLDSENAKIVMISSDMGSLSIVQPAAWYGYRMSKAAVNMLVHNLSTEFKQSTHSVFAIHPGWVQTDMGGEDAAISVSDSAVGILTTIDKLCKQQCGGYYDFTGKLMDF
jgi:NAD(P)-dependent dehydrogenase (short-subunit alcohol dehydrogenase family)